MNLSSIIKLMCMLTLTSLIYIHMQMQIVELAYKGKDKQKHIHDMVDNNGILRHQILALKSANHLGHELLEKDEGLQFMSNDSVVTYTGSKVPMQRPVANPRIKSENPLWNWLSLLSAQEAKAWER